MLQREIDAAIAEGRSIDYIDSKIIGPCRLSAHSRLALWVYAHSRLPAGKAPRRTYAARLSGGSCARSTSRRSMMVASEPALPSVTDPTTARL
jgi:hypothetical protein